MKLRTRLLTIAFLFTLLLSSFHRAAFAKEDTRPTPPSKDEALLYFNEACAGCQDYVESLDRKLTELGYQVERKDYINDKTFRQELNALSDEQCIPPKLQGHIATFVGDSIILEGHIPLDLVTSTVQASRSPDPWFEKIMLFQDQMKDAEWYKVSAFRGDVQQYDIEEPLTTYQSWYTNNKQSLTASDQCEAATDQNLLPLILVTGFLDGLNPCAFAVLLFFIAFLFTLKRTRAKVIGMGIAYIVAIYFTYLMIGIGLWQAIVITGVPHLMAKIGAYLVLALGVINLAGVLFPRFPIRLSLPGISKKTLNLFMEKATLPAALILGILVGLCTFPCSGGPYVAVLSLLTTRVTFLRGLGYLLIYNLMFVLPLILILAATGNQKVTEAITRAEQSASKMLHLVSGLVMIALGAIILIFFV